jgi:tape measure domain-containing protein
MDGRLKTLDNTARQLSSSMSTLGLGLTAALTAPIALAGRTAVKAAAEFEQARVAFGVFVGDAEQGAKVFEDIANLAAETPLDLSSLQRASQILLATGAAGDDLVGTLTMLGNASRGNAALLQRMALNFSQVATQGRLTGRELRDFAVAGVPLIQTLAEQFGKTEAEIQKMVSAGKIGFDDVAKAFQAMTGEGGKFDGLMKKMSQTLGGLWTTAVDNVRIALAGLVEDVLPSLKTFLQQVIDISKSLRRLSPEFKRIIVVAALLAAVLGPALLIVAKLISGFLALKALMALAGVALKPLLISLGVVLAKVMLVVGVFEVLRRVSVTTWQDLGTMALSFAKQLIGFFVNIRQNWTLLTDWWRNNWAALLHDLINNFLMLLKNLVTNFGVLIQKIGAIFSGLFNSSLSAFADFFLGILILVGQWGDAAVKAIAAVGTRIFNILVAAIKAPFSSEISFDDVVAEAGKILDDVGAIGQELANNTDQSIKDITNAWGTIGEGIERELKKTDPFKSLKDGFQKTFEDLPKFLTDFEFFLDRAQDKAKEIQDSVSVDTGAESPSTRLAEALEAGSREAFALLGSSTSVDENKKTQDRIRRNTETTAKVLTDIKSTGIRTDAKVVSGALF